MSTESDTMGPPRLEPRSTTWALTVSGAQVAVIVVLAWLWSGDSAEASSNSIDWEFVALCAATPLVLAASSLIGWRARRHLDPAGPLAIRVTSTASEWITCGLFACALLVTPSAILGALLFGPMG